MPVKTDRWTPVSVDEESRRYSTEGQSNVNAKENEIDLRQGYRLAATDRCPRCMGMVHTGIDNSSEFRRQWAIRNKVGNKKQCPIAVGITNDKDTTTKEEK